MPIGICFGSRIAILFEHVFLSKTVSMNRLADFMKPPFVWRPSFCVHEIDPVIRMVMEPARVPFAVPGMCPRLLMFRARGLLTSPKRSGEMTLSYTTCLKDIVDLTFGCFQSHETPNLKTT